MLQENKLPKEVRMLITMTTMTTTATIMLMMIMMIATMMIMIMMIILIIMMTMIRYFDLRKQLIQKEKNGSKNTVDSVVVVGNYAFTRTHVHARTHTHTHLQEHTPAHTQARAHKYTHIHTATCNNRCHSCRRRVLRGRGRGLKGVDFDGDTSLQPRSSPILSLYYHHHRHHYRHHHHLA